MAIVPVVEYITPTLMPSPPEAAGLSYRRNWRYQKSCPPEQAATVQVQLSHT